MLLTLTEFATWVHFTAPLDFMFGTTGKSRIQRVLQHDCRTVLVLCTLAVAFRADSLEEIGEFGEFKQGRLHTLPTLPYEVPSLGMVGAAQTSHLLSLL